MSITMRCAECNRSYRMRDDGAGKQLECPECGGVLSVRRVEPKSLGDVLGEAAAYEDNHPVR